MGKSRKFSNQLLLLFLLFLDIAGFTLIFPLIPALLEHYIGTAHNQGLDSWLPQFVKYIDHIFPLGHPYSKSHIVLLGGLTAALYSLTQFLSAPYWGRLSDYLGRRKVLLLTSLGLALSYLLWFFSDSFTFFCLSRLLGGLMGGNIGVASAAMADMSPPQKRVSSMGMTGAAFGLGFLLGPVLGGLSIGIDFEPWSKHPFGGAALAAFLLSLASACLNFFKFQETLSSTRRRASPWISNPLSSLKELPDPQYRRIVFINFFYIFIFSSYEFTFSFYYSLDFGLSAKEIGYVFFYLGLCYILGQGGLVRLLARKYSPRCLLHIGLCCIPLPICVFGFCAPALGLSLLVLIPVSLGSSLVIASLSGLASLKTPPDKQGHALGLLRSFGSLGRCFSPLAAAPLYWFAGAQITYCIFGLLLLILLLYVLFLKKHN